MRSLSTTPTLPIFIHIHKCGGSSLAAVMRRNLRRAAPQLQPSDQMASLSPKGLVQSILKTARRDGYVMGHLGYGCHRIFTAPCAYYTMLREPQARLVSLWRHAVSTPSAYYHKQARGCAFSSFLAQQWPLELDNGLVRFLSGDPAGENVFINPKPFGTLDESDLQMALDNLKHRLHAFGLVEHFDESLLLMKPRLGLRSCLYSRRNESSGAVPKPDFPDEALPLVALDRRLYAEAHDLFRQRVAEQLPSLDSTVKHFQARNQTVQPIFATVERWRTFAKTCMRGTQR